MFIYGFHMILGINTNFFSIHCNGYNFRGCKAGNENTDQML